MSKLLQIVTNLLFYALLQGIQLNRLKSSFGDKYPISVDKYLISGDEMVFRSLFRSFWFQVRAKIKLCFLCPILPFWTFDILWPTSPLPPTTLKY